MTLQAKSSRPSDQGHEAEAQLGKLNNAWKPFVQPSYYKQLEDGTFDMDDMEEDQTIRSICHPETILPRKLVRDVWTENNWDERKIRAAVLPVGVANDVVEEIMSILINEANKDVAHWVPTPQGNFTTSSAWDLIRHQKESMEMFKLIWNPVISLSMSIFA
ncbi:hypothetical protein SASPL_118005 [Salvia splendens]|uniref:Uncharacterized protein n=1 Tax=Salvia splendens TaxID=180675 RepID=A0A8X8ZY30_SALSN|nr:hypothetical protein SASPL_118005 [Salvia splendens]